MHIQKEVTWNTESSTLQPDRPQHAAPYKLSLNSILWQLRLNALTFPQGTTGRVSDMLWSCRSHSGEEDCLSIHPVSHVSVYVYAIQWPLIVLAHQQYKNMHTGVPPYPLIQNPWFTAARKKGLENLRNKQFVSFKTSAKRKRAVTWWNPAAQTRLVHDSSSFAPILTLPRRTCLHSASSVLFVRVSFRVIAVFVFRKPIFINKLHRLMFVWPCIVNIM
jgi:hypothetical protein